MNLRKNWWERAVAFHDDERGLEALQVVMIVAIAAVCLIAVKYKWDTIRKWFSDMISEGTGEDQWKSD